MATGKNINNSPAFISWLIFLSCIVILAAVIVNFKLGDRQFQSELAEYLVNNQVSASSVANTGSISGGVK